MIHNPKTASVTELRQNATKLLQQVEDTKEPLFILQNSKKAAVLLDEESFEQLLDGVRDKKDYEIAEVALHEKKKKHYTWRDIEKMRLKK